MPNHDDNGLIAADTLAGLAPSGEAELLRHVAEERRIPPGRQVFVNRAVRLEKTRFVGFDLDWTLADYDQEAMSRLAFELAVDRLVERRGYPAEIRRAEFRPDFARRGLMLDVEAGTVLKMNRHRYVGRAYLGRQFLEPGERARLYRQEPINPGSDRFYFVDTLFELPEVCLFSELVELGNRGSGLSLPGYGELYRDVRAEVDELHADDTLKATVRADLPRFLPRDPELPLALLRLRLGGRRLLLITNSEHTFTEAVCSYLFDGALPGIGSWRELFDLVVVEARKPGFFRKARRFQEVGADGRPGAEVDEPAWGGLYAGGSREELMRLLDCPGEDVLYVGDHIYGDVLSSKLVSTWRTALVIPELEEEMEVLSELASQLRHADVLRAELADLGQRMDNLGDLLTLYREASGNGQPPEQDACYRRVRRLLSGLRREHQVMRQHKNRLQGRISKAINPYWGSLFKQGSNKSLFGSQVDDFACIYTSRVSNFAAYGSSQYFRVLRDPMMHDDEL